MKPPLAATALASVWDSKISAFWWEQIPLSHAVGPRASDWSPPGSEDAVCLLGVEVQGVQGVTLAPFRVFITPNATNWLLRKAATTVLHEWRKTESDIFCEAVVGYWVLWAELCPLSGEVLTPALRTVAVSGDGSLKR